MSTQTLGLDCAPLAGHHSTDRVTVHAGYPEPLYMCGRHAHYLDAADFRVLAEARKTA